jgi:hypothetical protein
MRGRIYANTQKQRLLAEVRRLCGVLDRPVCSKDLARAFNANPERQPIFLQSLGQVLIKAARPVPQPALFLHRVGKFGNLAFYAPDSDSSWSRKFDSHVLKLNVARAVQEQFPARASVLCQTAFESLARNAISGFLREWESAHIRERLSDPALLFKFEIMLGQAKKFAAAEFYKRSPSDFVDRAAAADFLREEFAARSTDVTPERHNVNRHLSILKWPQSVLFAGDHVGQFSTLQLRCYAAARWPQCMSSCETADSLRLCLRYGMGCGVVPADTLLTRLIAP